MSAPRLFGEEGERLGEHVQPLVRADPRQEPDGERQLRGRRCRCLAFAVSGKIQAERHHVEAAPLHLEVARHEVGGVPAGGYETLRVGGALPQQAEGFRPERLDEPLEEDLLPLHRAQHRDSEDALQPPGKAEEETVGQQHDIRPEVGAQPPDETFELAPLVALRAAEHGHGEGPEVAGLRRSREARHPFQQGGAPEGPVDEPGHAPEGRQLLLEKDPDAAVEHLLHADVRLVGA